MRRHFLTGIAVLGSVLALAACDDADTIQGNATNELLTTASVSAEYSVPDAEFGNGKASIFGVPREARIIFW